MSWSSGLALVGAFSCSVFPENATLLGANAVAPAGGSSDSPAAGVGQGLEPTLLGGAGVSEGGSLSVGGAGPVEGGEGGASDVAGGAGGAGGAAPACKEQQRVVVITADTWIESVKPGTGHGKDSVLSVVGGGQERRALLEATLPAAPAGAVLLAATLVLHLQSNADVSLDQRQLRLHQLSHVVIEGRASWNNWDNGSKGKWLMPGGDFGAAVAQSSVPAGTSQGTVTFDVTRIAHDTFAASPVPLSLVLLETSAPPPAPAELAFTSTEGDASAIPALIIHYCEP